MANTVRPKPANYDPNVDYYRKTHRDPASGQLVYDDTNTPIDQSLMDYQQAVNTGRVNPDGSYNYSTDGNLSPAASIANGLTFGAASKLLPALDPARGNDTLAAAYGQAQQQAAALSDLQWNRQMQGLQGALGYVQQGQSLHDHVFGGSGPPGGGGTPGGVNPNSQPGPNGGRTFPFDLHPAPIPDFQSILDRLNAAGGPQGIPPAPTTQNSFTQPPAPGTGDGRVWPGLGQISPTNNPIVAPSSRPPPPPAPPPYQAPPPPSGITTQQSALTAPPPAPRPPAAISASQALDKYLGQPLPTASIAQPSFSSFVAPPAPPPPPMQPAVAALPGLADFLAPQAAPPSSMATSLIRKGWGGF